MLAFQNMAKIYYYICIWAVCLLAACSAGDDATSFPGQADVENRVGVTLQLSALSSQTSQSSRSSLTRAAWETDTEAMPGEMMKSWFVVVVQNGKIEKIITSDLKSLGVTEVEKDQVFVELNKGETTFYSFANIKPEEIGLNASTSVGQLLPADFDEKTYQMDGNCQLFHQLMTPDFQNGYPMSNKQVENITDNQQVINLEVIRMVAKVQLSITNDTDHAINLKTITLSDVTQNGNQNIKLLPNVDSANILKGVNLADGVAKGTITLTAAENDGITIEAGAKQTACFYMNESLVDKGEDDGGNRYFILSLTTVDAATDATSNHRYAMLSWNEIRRNDYLKIPIKLEDYQIRWKVEAFSPIGVLPKVTDDGENLSLDFGYYGEFHIKPEVIKLSRTGSQTLSVSEWQMGTDATGSDGWTRQEQNPQGADGVNIFDASPSWIPVTYRLEGEMGNRTGSAIYTMKIKVKEQNGLGMYPIISRKVRFTMKQVDLTRAGKNTEKIVLNTKTFGNERK